MDAWKVLYSPSNARVDLTKVVDEGWETALILEGDDILNFSKCCR